MELNIWTSSTVTSATKNASTSKWDVTVKRGDGTERVFHVDHVVFALGLGAGKPNLPSYPGRVSIRDLFVHAARSSLMGYYRRTSRDRCYIQRSTSHGRTMWARKSLSLVLVCPVRPRCTFISATRINLIIFSARYRL